MTGVGPAELLELGPNRYRLEPRGDMKAGAVVYLSPDLLPPLREDGSLQQLADAACLPGVWDPVVGLPDIHSGFGLPIGGVMVTDWPEGVVSAGAVGMDINCGVRLLRTGVPVARLEGGLLPRLLQALAERIPAGVGKASRLQEVKALKLEDVFAGGAGYVVERGLGQPEDLQACEEKGCLIGADPGALSARAWERADQLATLGGGNHFLELDRVEKVYCPAAAACYGLAEGDMVVLIHTGSRGLGHQVCTDYTQRLWQSARALGLKLPGKGLAAAPCDSPAGREYLGAMACAVNFAFANRQLITMQVREVLSRLCEAEGDAQPAKVVYDVAHNIAKVERHRGQTGLVHRKGATRALAPGHPDNPSCYRESGHPSLVPGSMGTASYVLRGTPHTAETYFSVNHGAGRRMSRKEARRHVSKKAFAAQMGEVIYWAPGSRPPLDEAPAAYKDIVDVVETLAVIGLVEPVARLKPLAVMKGD